MAESKTPPVGTEKLQDHPELAGLKEREKCLFNKLKHLDKLDAEEQARGGVDISQVKRQATSQLAEVRKAIHGFKK